MTTKRACISTALLMVGACATALGQAQANNAVPYPNAQTPEAMDLGAVVAQPNAAPMAVTVVLNLRAASEAESLLKAVSTPGGAQYHQFLTAEEFAQRFAPTDAEVEKVTAGLTKYGLTVERTTALTLKVTGGAANLERAFSVNLHQFEVAGHDNVPGYGYHAPLTAARIPDAIAGSVRAVVGLDNHPSMYPHQKAAAHALASARPNSTGDAPGEWTVTDFADYYDVDPLYKAGITGKGRTLGIITFASFTPSDAFTYWKAIGLTVDAKRLTVVNVDGGPGKPSDASGSLETTLDVEQSGGVAPGAKIIVYQAPNTDQGAVDVFAEAVAANKADSLSSSWGAWEWLQNLENSPVIDPLTGLTEGVDQATHELLVWAALEGQSVYTSSGDGGAYDADDTLGCLPRDTKHVCTRVLSVDYPASDPAITAAGGTTLPGVQEFCLNAACTPPFYSVNIPHERVWGWDYLEGLCKAIGLADPIACGIFPGGGGGGVSVSFEQPFYQFFTPGIALSQPRQNFVYDGTLYYSLPPFFPGRNVPDISFNADPDTGYIVVYTSSKTGLGVQAGWGGTSFVAPQLNGVTALLGQYIHGRIGLLNYPLYFLSETGQAYRGPNAPVNAIKYGDNWFYRGSDGYNQGVGFGTLNVANFAHVLGTL